jgi:dinuclear metal center YbgI/SA1388 family protein
MNVADLVRTMEAIAPACLAAPWDNVGLLVGDPDRQLQRVLLTIDCTRPVFDEALRAGASAIVSYHPPIYGGQKRFAAGSIAYEAARADVAIYSPHTALDAADGGTNDVLADALAMTDRAPLRATLPAGQEEYKLVTFVPAEHADAVSRAVFDAGAGRIGKYSACSFRVAGTGTFFGEEGTSPAVGESGRLEQAPELRLETVVPAGRVGAVVRALRACHPYEEPAYDLVVLARAPQRGFGRIGPVGQTTVRALLERIKGALGVTQVLVAGELDRVVTRAAVCAGSGGDLVPDAIAAGAEVLLTGELRHHDALAAVAAGMGVVCALHSASERVALASLQHRLAALLPGLDVTRSTEDREPFMFA